MSIFMLCLTLWLMQSLLDNQQVQKIAEKARLSNVESQVKVFLVPKTRKLLFLLFFLFRLNLEFYPLCRTRRWSSLSSSWMNSLRRGEGKTCANNFVVFIIFLENDFSACLSLFKSYFPDGLRKLNENRLRW